jgi:hypothetical protein
MATYADGGYTATTQKSISIGLDGDQTLLGTGAGTVYAVLNTLLQAEGYTVDPHNSSVNNTTLVAAETNAQSTVDTWTLTGDRKVLIIWNMTQDVINVGQSTTLAALKTYVTARRGGNDWDEVWLGACLPFGTTGQGNNRKTFNNSVKADWANYKDAGFDGYIEAYYSPELTDQTNTTYYSSSTALANAGKAIIAQAIFDHIEYGGFFYTCPIHTNVFDSGHVFQRRTFDRDSGISTGHIMIKGYAFGQRQVLQARFNGQEWADVANLDGSQLTIGENEAFTGYLQNQVAISALATLEGRFKIAGGSRGGLMSQQYVGIGDVFMITGQSNAYGKTQGSHEYTLPAAYPNLTVSYYAASSDPDYTPDTPPAFGAVVWGTPALVKSMNTFGGTGPSSYWPYLANKVLEHTGLPCMFVQTAVPGIDLYDWTQGEDAYTFWLACINALGGARASLWHQGESDSSGPTLETYPENFAILAADMAADVLASTGIRHRIAPATLQVGFSDGNHDAFAAMIKGIWATADDNTLKGPDIHAVVTILNANSPNDGVHIKDDQARIAGEHWWNDAVRFWIDEV